MILFFLCLQKVALMITNHFIFMTSAELVTDKKKLRELIRAGQNGLLNLTVTFQHHTLSGADRDW